MTIVSFFGLNFNLSRQPLGSYSVTALGIMMNGAQTVLCVGDLRFVNFRRIAQEVFDFL